MTAFRRKLAICCAKLTGKIIQIFHKGNGATLPGYVARFICPDILSFLSGMIREKIIVTMGTNGKTTTNNLLFHALKAESKKVLCNCTGANMLNGVISAFVLACDKKGNLNADYACIEVDELSSVRIFPDLKPDCIVLTNISRDQLDRYGEIDSICNTIKEAVFNIPDVVLAVNCDDVISYSLCLECEKPMITYGIQEQIFDSVSRSGIPESIFCRFCQKKLVYDFFHYGQLGIYHCPVCGFQRPEPDYTASHVVSRSQTFTFDIGNIHITANTDAPYNIYNTLSAYTALCAVGAPLNRFEAAVHSFDYGNHRENTFLINNTCVRLHLAKNPIGFQQKIALILKDSSPKDLIIQINDTGQDGKDVSYLWDIDFQYLSGANIASITTIGSRCLDMGLRLKYEDIPCDVAPDMQSALRELTMHGTGNLYVIVNYSGLSQVNHLLEKLQNTRSVKEVFYDEA